MATSSQRRKQIKMIYTPLHFVPLIFTLLLATILLLLSLQIFCSGLYKNESENLINFHLCLSLMKVSMISHFQYLIVVVVLLSFYYQWLFEIDAIEEDSVNRLGQNKQIVKWIFNFLKRTLASVLIIISSLAFDSQEIH